MPGRLGPECTLARAQGRLTRVHSRDDHLNTAPNGSLQGFLKFGRTTPSRRKSDEALRGSEARFRAVASLVSGPAVALGCERNAELSQPALARLYRPEPGAVSGWRLARRHPPRRPSYDSRGLPHGSCRARLVEMQHRIRGHDGSYRWFLVRQTPITDVRGQLVEWFGAPWTSTNCVNCRSGRRCWSTSSSIVSATCLAWSQL